MLVPRITKADNSIVKQMYSEWYILRAVTSEYFYWDRNENVAFQEEQVEKKEMYEKMRILKADPERYKALEKEAFDMLTPSQKQSEAMPFHRDTKLREIISNMK